MGDSSSPSSSPTAAAAPPGAEAAAGAAVPVSEAVTTTGTASAAGRSTAPAVTAAASALTIDPTVAPARRRDAQPTVAAAGSRPSPPSSSRGGDRPRRDSNRGHEDDQEHDGRSQLSSEPSQKTHHISPASSTTIAPRRRSFFSRFTLPFRAPARTIADFHIRPAEPHRKYVAGDHVLGAVVLAVVKPVRITHLTVSLRGLVRVFKDPNSAATASLPTDTATDSSSSSSRLLASKSSSSSSSSYLGNGHALLFRDEMVLSGTGRLEPGNYEFEFDLIFPSQGLPSSIDFERGSICYVVTATLTRPTTVAPIQSCDRRVYLVDPVDIGAVPKPRPRTISLEPISKRSKKRKIVVVTQPPTATGSTTVIPAGSAGVPGAMSTISFASGGGSSDRQHDNATLSERGSARDSAHGTIQFEDEQEGYAEGRSRTSRVSQPRSPAQTDIRSEISVDSVTSGGSESRSRSSGIVGAAGGSGSGSGSGPGAGPGSGTGAGSNIIRLSSPTSSHAPASTAGHSAVSTTGTNTSSSTITNPAAGSNNGNSTSGNGYRSHNNPAPLSSVSTTTISGVVDDRTITATIDLLKGGCLPGEVVSVKVSVQHVKRIKSLHGVVVTLYRQGRIDSAPPEFMFPSAGTSIAEEDEGANGEGGGGNGVLINGSISGSQPHPDLDGEPSEPQSWKQKKQKEKEVKEKAKQLKDRQKDKERGHKSRKDKKGSGGSSNGSTKLENYYPKSKTGLGGLSLMSAGTCSVFRKDLSQSFSPLIIDPRTLQSSVTASVRMPEDAFATIKGVPGDMISFKYQLEVIVDLGGKLAGLLQSGVGPAGPNLVSNSSNPYDGKPMLAPTSALWSGGSNMIDTDQLRRQKGVIFVAFEVVVGTTDTSRQRGRGLKGAALSPDVQQQPDQQQVLLQQQQQQQPLPYLSHHPPNWYPEDRKGPYQQQPQQPPYPSWPENGTASGSGAAGPSTASPGPPDDPYYQQHHPYYQYPQQSGYDNQNYHHPHHHGPNYDYYDEPGSPSTGAPRPPYIDHGQSSQAPQYVPTAEMLAAERDPNMTEKERIRRAEQQLLPSQPGQPLEVSAPADNGEGSSSGSTNRHALSVPTAPSLDELTAYDPSAPPFDADAGSGPAQPPSEDKQELERRRLLAEASSPPTFPEDYDDVGPSSSSRGSRATRAAYAAGPSGSSRSGARAPSFSGGRATVAGPSAPSAPVLEEEDGHHQQYNQSPAYSHPPTVAPPPSSSPFPSVPVAGPSAPPASAFAQTAPPADAVLDDDIAGPATAPPAEDVDVAPEGTTDEDRYGRHYTYGPGSGTEAAHGSNGAAEHAEPLPRYER
ncbi:ph-response sensor protein [Sporothrix stenoceras]|uniref:Ph-response sensor protein n=1 Tax=Sporothrix stenoceras TaxID=5173 RepID=A0ABR3Z315_9PEZI